MTFLISSTSLWCQISKKSQKGLYCQHVCGLELQKCSTICMLAIWSFKGVVPSAYPHKYIYIYIYNACYIVSTGFENVFQ